MDASAAKGEIKGRRRPSVQPSKLSGSQRPAEFSEHSRQPPSNESVRPVVDVVAQLEVDVWISTSRQRANTRYEPTTNLSPAAVSTCSSQYRCRHPKTTRPKLDDKQR